MIISTINNHYDAAVGTTPVYLNGHVSFRAFITLRSAHTHTVDRQWQNWIQAMLSMTPV